MLITSEQNDRVLRWLIEKDEEVFGVCMDQSEELFGILPASFGLILEHFADIGFINAKHTSGGFVRIRTKVTAHDFFSRGGFFAQDDLLKKSLEKLMLEIESLKPSMPGKIETISTIVANIATALGLFSR